MALFILCNVGYGQIGGIVDAADKPGEVIWRANMLAKAVEQVDKAREMTEKIQKTATDIRKVKTTIEDIYSLQDAIRKGNISIDGIDALGWADLIGFAEKVLCISLDPTDYIPNLPANNEIILSLKIGLGQCGYEDIYSQTHGSYIEDWMKENGHFELPGGSYIESGNYNQSGSVYSSGYSSYGVTNEQDPMVILNNQKTKSDINAYALLTMSKKIQIKTASQYSGLADKLAERSIELAEAVKTEGVIEMSKAERLSLLSQCTDNLLKAIEYKTKAAELLAIAAKESEEEKIAYKKIKNEQFFSQLYKSKSPNYEFLQ